MLSGNNDNNYNHNCRYFRERRVENGRVRVYARYVCAYIIIIITFREKRVCRIIYYTYRS